MNYYLRILAVVLVLAGITGALIWRGPQQRDVAVVARSPEGAATPAGAPIRITFARPVDRLSAEQQFRLEPPATGSFAWDGNVMTFYPDQPLQSNTDYRVTIAAGLLDANARANAEPISWSFRTRAPRLLVLATDPTAGSTLWYTAADGSDAAPIYTAATGMLGVAAAPDGTHALGVVQRDMQRAALVQVDLRDGSEVILVDDPGATVNVPAWSPRGDLIAYERRSIIEGALGQPRIWLAQPDGTSLGPISGGDQVSIAPAWSPDGRRLAFSDGLSRTLGIYDFSSAPQLFPDSTGEVASWSPDGTQVVYTAAAVTGQPARPTLQVATLADGSTRVLVDTPGSTSPAWSPAGDVVVYTVRAADSPTTALWQVPAAGGAPQPLVPAGAYRDTLPAWSPDGKLLAFLRADLNRPGATVQVLDVASGTVQPLLPEVPAMQVVWVP